MSKFELNDILDDIRRREGDRYTNHPADRGGPTKYGITQATLSRWRGRPVSAQDVMELTWAEAQKIYRAEYIERPGWHMIQHQPLAHMLVDIQVNGGQPGRWLQEAANELGAGLRVDGDAGPQTRAAVNKLINEGYAYRLYVEVFLRRVKYYGRLVARDPSQSVFINEWLARACEYLDADGRETAPVGA